MKTSKLYTMITEHNSVVHFDSAEEIKHLRQHENTMMMFSKLIINKTGATFNFVNFEIWELYTLIREIDLKPVENVYNISNVSDYTTLRDAYNNGETISVILNNKGSFSRRELSKSVQNCEFKNISIIPNFPNGVTCNAYIKTKDMIFAELVKYYINMAHHNRGDKFRIGEKINETINSKQVDNVYHSPVTTISTCLQGNMPLTNLALFLQVTDKMTHCGFVYSEGKAYFANTRLYRTNNCNNKIAIIDKPDRNYSFNPDWAMAYNSDIWLPFTHLEQSEKEMYINENDDRDYATNSDLEFNSSVGYYNSDTHVIIDNDLFLKDDCVCLHNGEWCNQDDAVWVESEGEYYPSDECVCTHNNEWILERNSVCVNGNYYATDDEDLATCEDCNDRIIAEDSNSDNSGYYCVSCYESHESKLDRKCYSTNVIHHHGFGNSDLKINGKLVYVGLELECKAIDDANDISYINRFSNDNDYCVATEDGSLDTRLGLEFIFRPEGLREQKENVEDLIDNIASCLRFHNKASYNSNYGLHVHVSSHFLGEASKLKIQNFASLHHDHFQVIGGRGRTIYQNRKCNSFNKLDYERCQLVNITPSETIEFRFPAAIIDEDHININLEMALATTLFCKFNLSLVELKTKGQLTFIKYIKYVNEHKDQFPLLSEKLNTMELTILNKSAIAA